MTSIVVPAKHSLIVAVIFVSILEYEPRSRSANLLSSLFTHSKSTEEVATDQRAHAVKLPKLSHPPSSITSTFDLFSNALARHKSCLWP